MAEAALYCAHRTSTFLSCAFCEQEGHLAAPSLFFGDRLARAQGTHRATPSLLASFFSILLDRLRPFVSVVIIIGSEP